MYCLYIHSRIIDGIVFYIGIGNYKRPYIKNTRSIFWKNEVKKYDYNITILSYNLTWENAQEAEIKLISIYGRRDLKQGTLVNLTNGGDGSPGSIQSEISNKNRSKSMLGKNKGIKNPMYGKNPYLNKIHSRAKKVINTKTLIVYPNIKSVLDIINVPKTTFLRWLNHPSKNKTSFEYFKE